MALGAAAVGAVTALYARLIPVNPTTVALTYLAVILLIASSWGITESTTASLLAVLCFNFFFLPPSLTTRRSCWLAFAPLFGGRRGRTDRAAGSGWARSKWTSTPARSPQRGGASVSHRRNSMSCGIWSPTQTPSAPVHILTDPWVGYRLRVPEASA
jgi:hypothetical protein